MRTRTGGQALEELVTRARDAFNEGDPHASRRLYARVLDALGSAPGVPEQRNLRVRALLGVANARFERDGDVAASLALVDEAAGLVAGTDDGEAGHDLAAAVSGQRARVLFLAGRIDESMAAFASAEGHLATASARDRLTLLVNRGVLHMDVGSLQAARADFERVVAEGDTAGQPLLAYKARHNLGWLSFLEGDLPAAMATMANAPHRSDDDPLDEDPIALLDRARVLLEAGLAGEADDLLGTAVAAFQDVGRFQDEAEATVARARAALVDGDAGRAIDHAQSAAAAFLGRGNRRWYDRARVIGLEAELLSLEGDGSSRAGNGTATVDDLRVRAMQVAADSDDPDVVATAHLIGVEAALASGDDEVAAALLADVSPPERSSLTSRLRLARAQAGLALAQGAAAGVRAAVDRGVGDLARAQSTLGSLDLRTAMAIHGRELVDVGIRAALRHGDAEDIHRAVELAHAASTRLTPVRSRRSGRERELLGRLRRAEEHLWRPDLTPEGREGFAHRIDDLQRRLRRRDWQRDGSVVDALDVVDLPTLQGLLAEQAAVAVSFLEVDGRLQAVRVDARDLAVVDLGSVEAVLSPLRRLQADLRARTLPSVSGAMAAAVDASLRSCLAELDQRLCTALDVDRQSLVVVPHGDLALVPWTLLPGRRGLPTTTAPCATQWVATMQRSTRAATTRPPGCRPVVRALAGPRLERAAEEAAAVAARWDAVVGEPGSVATSESLQAALRDADVVHLAAHGTHRRRSPLFSSILLADGPFYAHELDDVGRVGAVILSACEVGEHSMRPGDELLGLSAALLEGGAHTVVASLGRIRDDVACDVMVQVHDLLAAGYSPADAVAQASATAWERGSVAPLVVLGAGFGPI